MKLKLRTHKGRIELWEVTKPTLRKEWFKPLRDCTANFYDIITQHFKKDRIIKDNTGVRYKIKLENMGKELESWDIKDNYH